MKLSVIIPAYNEEKTIEGVIRDFHSVLKKAEIFVIDNNSKDKTSSTAAATLKKLKCRGGVLKETQQGKAFAMRKAFTEIESDYYLIVDADLTYPAAAAPLLVKEAAEGNADMVVGDRLSRDRYKKENKRAFHNFGNNLVRILINFLFRSRLKDIMSGYRVFNRKFVKNFPVMSKGFEIETEMTLHALDKRFKISEVPIEYRDRPKGSVSKLNTVTDGFKVIKTILWIFKDYKPLVFFLTLSLVSLLGGLAAGIPVVIEFLRDQYVYKVPSAILSTGLIILSMLLLSVGLILDTNVTNHKFDYELQLMKRR